MNDILEKMMDDDKIQFCILFGVISLLLFGEGLAEYLCDKLF